MSTLRLSRARITVVVCLLVAGYFLYTASLGAVRSSEIARDRQAAEQQVEQLRHRLATLEGIRDYVASDTYVEQQARRQLGYVRPGEVAFIVSGPSIVMEQEESARWWERLFPQ